MRRLPQDSPALPVNGESEKRCGLIELGIVDYNDAWEWQKRLVNEKYTGVIQQDVLLLLEHNPVFTIGKRGGKDNLKVPLQFIEQSGVAIIQVERGGFITYHGPGQVVGYPILNLRDMGLRVVEYVERLEEVMIRTAADFGVIASRNSLNRGVWVNAQKLGSVGVAVRHSISFHGFAFNVNLDMEPFQWIHPCGLKGIHATCLEQEIKKDLKHDNIMDKARESIKKHFESVFSLRLERKMQNVECRMKNAELRMKKMLDKKIHRKPHWLKLRLPSGKEFGRVSQLLRSSHLYTVCQEAQCPNRWECFSQQTAAFLIMGPNCTRNCRFCAVEKGVARPIDPNEPVRVANAAKQLDLSYVVVTSVTRDDLPDGGASCFVHTIHEIRKELPHARIEVLIPDFQGNIEALQTVLNAHPNVLNHNLETVSRLYPVVRPEADYQRSLEILRHASDFSPSIPVKSGLMLGLGETAAEIEQAFSDLIAFGCAIVTLGQYLQPTKHNYPVERYLPPEEFDHFKKIGLKMGFKQVFSGPLVRSSYHAKELFLSAPGM